MADALRELAEQHPELLTVECEASHRHRFVLDEVNWWDCDGGRCPLCNGTGRRLKTLEELLEAIKDRTRSRVTLTQGEKDNAPIQRSISFSYDWDATRVEIEVDAAGAAIPRGAFIEEAQGATEWEAAARLAVRTVSALLANQRPKGGE